MNRRTPSRSADIYIQMFVPFGFCTIFPALDISRRKLFFQKNRFTILFLILDRFVALRCIDSSNAYICTCYILAPNVLAYVSESLNSNDAGTYCFRNVHFCSGFMHPCVQWIDESSVADII